METDLAEKNDKLLKVEMELKDLNLKMFENEKTGNKLNNKLNYLKEKEVSLDELQTRCDKLEKKVDTISIEKKDDAIDNIVTSMLEKFRKLEERLFNLEIKETEGELSICMPMNTEKY